MALSNPATKAEFFDLLPVQEENLRLVRQVEINNLGGGEILQSELFPAMWVGSVKLAPMPKRQAARIQAFLAQLEAPGQVFQAYKPNQIGPADDPLGTTLGASVPVIAELGAVNNDRLKIGGLPDGYAINVGDFFGFDYDPGTGTRRAFHQSTRYQVAQEDGILRWVIYVEPPLRPGAQLAAEVDLIKPHFLAVLVPGSVNYGITRGNNTSGIQFEFRQTLKA